MQTTQEFILKIGARVFLIPVLVGLSVPAFVGLACAALIHAVVETADI